MFKAVALIMSLAGDPVGVGVGTHVFDTQAACQERLPAYLARMNHDLPGHKFKVGCIAQADADKIESDAAAKAKDDGSI